MSKQDQAQILNMLQEGKITVEEAQSLLEALKAPKEEIVQNKKNNSRKMLKVLVKSQDGDDIKVQVPVEFAKFLKVGIASDKLDQHDIDVEELIKLIEDGVNGEIVDIKTADGDFVKVVVE